MNRQSRRASLALVCLCAAAVAQAQTTDATTPSVTVYGSVYLNGFSNSGGTNNEDIPLWAQPGTGDTSATARQTRFGVRAALPSALGARTTATVETDFYGGFPAIGTGESFGQLRLRLASVHLDWARTSLVVGQDWMVFAPNNPTSLACVAIPLFAAAGNAWARLPQVRVEQRFGPGLLQAAVLAPQSGDFNSAFLAQPDSGALSKLPYFQGRLAVSTKDWLGSGKPATLGVSGHYGRSRVLVTGKPPSDVDSNGGALDWSVPVGPYVLVLAEAFTGRNLAGFQAGVFQGINPDSVSSGVAPAPRGIATKGGWAQVVLSAGTSPLSLMAAGGIDDPEDADLVSATAHNWRLRNQVLAFGASYRASAQISFGVEYRLLETRLLQTGTQKDRHLNVGAVVAF